jgi:hypothetical protein
MSGSPGAASASAQPSTPLPPPATGAGMGPPAPGAGLPGFRKGGKVKKVAKRGK